MITTVAAVGRPKTSLRVINAARIKTPEIKLASRKNHLAFFALPGLVGGGVPAEDPGGCGGISGGAVTVTVELQLGHFPLRPLADEGNCISC